MNSTTHNFGSTALFALALLLGNSLTGTVRAAALELAVGERSARPQQPQAAVDSRGMIHVGYGIRNTIRYCHSTDRGASFSTPSELPDLGVVALGMRRGPRIAVVDDQVCVTAIGGPKGLGKVGDVLACSSADGGKTWQGPIRVNDAPNAAREGLHGMASGSDGLLCCVWLDLRHGKTEVMSSTSRDHGTIWSGNVLVYRSPDGSVCKCCHPSVAIGRDQRIHVLWRNSLAGNRDMYVATSNDAGQTFGEAMMLGADHWPLDACPMDGGAIACLADYRERGLEGMTPKKSPGRASRATAEYREALRAVVQTPPQSLGYGFSVWSLARLAAHLKRQTGVSLSEDQLGRVLRAEGFSYQRRKHTMKGKRDEVAYERARRALKTLKKRPSNRMPTKC